MLLQSLVSHYDALANAGFLESGRCTDDGLSKWGYGVRKITHEIILDQNGDIVRFDDIQSTHGKRKRPMLIHVPGTLLSRSTGISPNFLWETDCAYLLGYQAPKAPIKQVLPPTSKSMKRLLATKKYYLGVQSTVNDPQFDIVCQFIAKWEQRMRAVFAYNSARKAELLSLPSDKQIDIPLMTGMVFRIEGSPQYVLEQPNVVKFWDDHFDYLSEKAVLKKPAHERERCFITGKQAVIAKKKHNPGIQIKSATGLKLCSTNDTATSHGLALPLGEEAAFKYCTTLNYFVRNRGESSKHHISLGDKKAPLVIVHWADFKPNIDQFEELVGSALLGYDLDKFLDKEDELANTFNQIANGHAPTSQLLDGDYHVVWFAPKTGRLMMRYYYRNSCGGIVRNVTQHFKDISIRQKPIPIWRLTEFVRDPNQKRRYITELTTAAITGAEYPIAIYREALSYCRVKTTRLYDLKYGKMIWYPYIGLIKGYLNRLFRSKNLQEFTLRLDKNRSEPAYHVGRLFAIAEFVQLANGKNATVGATLFSKAATRPAAVILRLVEAIRNHRHCLNTKMAAVVAKATEGGGYFRTT